MAGRPTDYRPEYCDQVIALGQEGNSKTQIAVALGVVRSTLDYWAAHFPEFSTALTRALEAQENYWESIHASFAKNPEHRGNSTLQHLMKSRFRETYGEKQQVEQTTTTTHIFTTEAPEL